MSKLTAKKRLNSMRTSIYFSAIVLFLFFGDALGQDVVEGRDAVACHHHQQIIANGIDIADLAVIDSGLAGEIEVGAGKGVQGFRFIVSGSMFLREAKCPPTECVSAFSFHISSFP
jgi:hypothetical protein